MIRITDKSLCSGCTACEAICTRQCIVRHRDREGFDYPVANPDMCIQCGRCEEVCPMINKAKRSRDDVSAGEFHEAALQVLSRSGVVYGVGIEPDKTVSHVQSHDVESLNVNRYVQSDLYASFEEIRDYLADNTEVLFCGTPCQAEGLVSYLGGEPENLKIYSFECMGVASPGLWQKYNLIADKKNMYWSLYQKGLTLRPSCYKCSHLAREVKCDMAKREEFFKGVHSAKDLRGYLSKYAQESIIFIIQNMCHGFSALIPGSKNRK